MNDKGDYIRRADAIKACELQIINYKDGHSFGAYYPRADEIAEKIKDIPSADVAERKRGKWLCKRDRVWVECSVCNSGSTFSTKYCGNCGAEMDKELVMIDD